MRVEKTLIQTLACQLSSTPMQLLFSFDQDMGVEKTLIQTLACQLSSTPMQLLFSFDQDMGVEKTLIQTLACQLLSIHMQLLFSFDQDMRIEKILIQTLNFHPLYSLLASPGLDVEFVTYLCLTSLHQLSTLLDKVFHARI